MKKVKKDKLKKVTGGGYLAPTKQSLSTTTTSTSTSTSFPTPTLTDAQKALLSSIKR